jgi:hypothetical protein
MAYGPDYHIVAMAFSLQVSQHRSVKLGTIWNAQPCQLQTTLLASLLDLAHRIAVWMGLWQRRYDGHRARRDAF